MHQNGAGAKEIQKVLGHTKIQTTLDLYIHTNEEMILTATDKLGEAITVAV